MLLYLVSLLPKGKSGAVQRWRMGPTVGILPHMAAPRHPLAGPVCLVFWADRGPGASCPYGEGPRRALVTFPRWKVTRGVRGGAEPRENPYRRLISKPVCRHSTNWMVRSTGRTYPKPAGVFRGQPPQAALLRSAQDAIGFGASPCPGSCFLPIDEKSRPFGWLLYKNTASAVFHGFSV